MKSLDLVLADVEILAIKTYRAVSQPIYSAFEYVNLPICTCRYTPTCSQYAEEAIKIHGAVKGTAMAGRRIMRCNPAGGFGYDPVSKIKL